jgi:hypothetical protein
MKEKEKKIKKITSKKLNLKKKKCEWFWCLKEEDIKKEKKNFFLEKGGCINLMQSHFCLVFMHVDHKINTQTRTFMIISYGKFFFFCRATYSCETKP